MEDSKLLLKRSRLLFSEYLKKKRQNSGFTQKEVSDALNFTHPQFISNIERGLAPVPFDVLSRMMDLYKISQKELMDEYLKMQRSIAISQLKHHQTKSA